MTTLSAPPVAGRRVPLAGSPTPAGSWLELAARVREFQPDVVVLIARKMPRLAELFELKFGHSCLVMSDLAIPFAHAFLKNARVAVVDDVVNVGTTLQHSASCLRACGAEEVELFSLGRRARSPRDLRVHCVYSEPFDDLRYNRVVGSVPEAIRALAKPYDLVFPTIPCRLALPFRTAGQVLARLSDRFGSAAVHHLPSQASGRGPSRVTVDLPGGLCGNCKLRLYFGEEEKVCNLVPFIIPPRLSRDSFEIASPSAKHLLKRLQAALRGAPPEASLWKGEALCQALLFVASFDQGLRLVDELSDVLSLRGNAQYDQRDAEMLFGPAVVESSLASFINETDSSLVGKCVEGWTIGESPFLKEFTRPEIIALIKSRASSLDAYSTFTAIFDVLAEQVGAADPSQYRLTWPYTKKQVLTKPYRRLRVGPTFDDLVALIDCILGNVRSAGRGTLPLRHVVSALLDYAIDSGTVVPTIARYNSGYYRIYRKGERDEHDLAIERVKFAWRNSQKDLSLTTFTKINAILAFCEDFAPVLSPMALERGNVATLHATVLDSDAAEIGRYLRDTGQLQRRETNSEQGK